MFKTPTPWLIPFCLHRLQITTDRSLDDFKQALKSLKEESASPSASLLFGDRGIISAITTALNPDFAVTHTDFFKEIINFLIEGAQNPHYKEFFMVPGFFGFITQAYLKNTSLLHPIHSLISAICNSDPLRMAVFEKDCTISALTSMCHCGPPSYFLKQNPSLIGAMISLCYKSPMSKEIQDMIHCLLVTVTISSIAHPEFIHLFEKSCREEMLLVNAGSGKTQRLCFWLLERICDSCFFSAPLREVLKTRGAIDLLDIANPSHHRILRRLFLMRSTTAHDGIETFYRMYQQNRVAVTACSFETILSLLNFSGIESHSKNHNVGIFFHTLMSHPQFNESDELKLLLEHESIKSIWTQNAAHYANLLYYSRSLDTENEHYLAMIEAVFKSPLPIGEAFRQNLEISKLCSELSRPTHLGGLGVLTTEDFNSLLTSALCPNLPKLFSLLVPLLPFQPYAQFSSEPTFISHMYALLKKGHPDTLTFLAAAISDPQYKLFFENDGLFISFILLCRQNPHSDSFRQAILVHPDYRQKFEILDELFSEGIEITELFLVISPRLKHSFIDLFYDEGIRRALVEDELLFHRFLHLIQKTPHENFIYHGDIAEKIREIGFKAFGQKRVPEAASSRAIRINSLCKRARKSLSKDIIDLLSLPELSLKDEADCFFLQELASAAKSTYIAYEKFIAGLKNLDEIPTLLNRALLTSLIKNFTTELCKRDRTPDARMIPAIRELLELMEGNSMKEELKEELCTYFFPSLTLSSLATLLRRVLSPMLVEQALLPLEEGIEPYLAHRLLAPSTELLLFEPPMNTADADNIRVTALSTYSTYGAIHGDEEVLRIFHQIMEEDFSFIFTKVGIYPFNNEQTLPEQKSLRVFALTSTPAVALFAGLVKGPGAHDNAPALIRFLFDPTETARLNYWIKIDDNLINLLLGEDTGAPGIQPPKPAAAGKSPELTCKTEENALLSTKYNTQGVIAALAVLYEQLVAFGGPRFLAPILIDTRPNLIKIVQAIGSNAKAHYSVCDKSSRDDIEETYQVSLQPLADAVKEDRLSRRRVPVPDSLLFAGSRSGDPDPAAAASTSPFTSPFTSHVDDSHPSGSDPRI